MLVNVMSHPRDRSTDESGSALVTVVIVMMALMVGALALAAVVMGTASDGAAAHTRAVSRAAADAGIADAVSHAQRTGDLCPADAVDAAASYVHHSGEPEYTVTARCDTQAGTVTYVATGTGAHGAQTRTLVEYSYSTGDEAPQTSEATPSPAASPAAETGRQAITGTLDALVAARDLS